MGQQHFETRLVKCVGKANCPQLSHIDFGRQAGADVAETGVGYLIEDRFREGMAGKEQQRGAAQRFLGIRQLGWGGLYFVARERSVGDRDGAQAAILALGGPQVDATEIGARRHQRAVLGAPGPGEG